MLVTDIMDIILKEVELFGDNSRHGDILLLQKLNDNPKANLVTVQDQ